MGVIIAKLFKKNKNKDKKNRKITAKEIVMNIKQYKHVSTTTSNNKSKTK